MELYLLLLLFCIICNTFRRFLRASSIKHRNDRMKSFFLFPTFENLREFWDVLIWISYFYIRWFFILLPLVTLSCVCSLFNYFAFRSKNVSNYLDHYRMVLTGFLFSPFFSFSFSRRPYFLPCSDIYYVYQFIIIPL